MIGTVKYARAGVKLD